MMEENAPTNPQNKHKTAHTLFTLSYYLGFAAWGFFFLFLIGLFTGVGIVNVIGWMGAVAALALSVIFEEISNRLYGEGNGVLGILIIIAALVCVAVSIYGYAVQDHVVIATAVVVLLFASFVPGIVDAFNRRQQEREFGHYSAGGSAGGLAVFEMFGVPAPKEPPPIVQETAQNRDEAIEERFGVVLDQEVHNLENDTVDSTAVSVAYEVVTAPSIDVASEKESLVEDEHADAPYMKTKALPKSPIVGDIIKMVAKEGEWK